MGPSVAGKQERVLVLRRCVNLDLTVLIPCQAIEVPFKRA